MIGRSIIAAKARVTASMSALTKLTVTGARDFAALVCACAGSQASSAQARIQPRESLSFMLILWK